MIQVCKFDPVRDIEETVPGLSASVAEIMATHQVVSTSDSTPYSKEDDVNAVGNYITDKIDAAIKMLGLEKQANAARAAVKSGSGKIEEPGQ